MLARPREILNAIADDVDRQLLGRGMKFFAKVARRPAAGLFPIGDHDDDAWLMLIVEHRCSLLHRLRQGRAAPRRQSVHRAHDDGPGIRSGLEIEVDVALLVRPWAISDEADAAKFRGARQNLSKRVPGFVNPWDGGPDTLSHIPGHRARRIEHDHGVLVTGGHFRLRRDARAEPTGNPYRQGYGREPKGGRQCDHDLDLT